jgi:hypothetical protein
VGAGNMYHFLKKSGVESIKMVEQDYQVAQIAKKHFGLEEAAADIEYKPPRAWLNENDKKTEFDLIIHDAFSLGYRPVDSLSRQAIKKLDCILSITLASKVDFFVWDSLNFLCSHFIRGWYFGHQMVWSRHWTSPQVHLGPSQDVEGSFPLRSTLCRSQAELELPKTICPLGLLLL